MLKSDSDSLGAKLSSLGSILDIVRSAGAGSIDLLEGSEHAEITEIRIVDLRFLIDIYLKSQRPTNLI